MIEQSNFMRRKDGEEMNVTVEPFGTLKTKNRPDTIFDHLQGGGHDMDGVYYLISRNADSKDCAILLEDYVEFLKIGRLLKAMK